MDVGVAKQGGDARYERRHDTAHPLMGAMRDYIPVRDVKGQSLPYDREWGANDGAALCEAAGIRQATAAAAKEGVMLQ